MARAKVYQRSLDVVINAVAFESIESKTENEVLNQIKQEPCSGSDKDEQKTSSSDIDTSTLFEEGKDNMASNVFKQMGSENRMRKRHERHSLGDDTSNTSVNKPLTRLQKYKGSYRLIYENNSRFVTCHICLLSFKSDNALNHHRLSYRRRKKDSRASLSTSQRYKCNFCPRTFKVKCHIQAHLFHIHRAELSVNGRRCSFGNQHKLQSNSTKKKNMRQTTLREYILPRNQSEYSESTMSTNLNDSNISSKDIIKPKTDLNNSSLNLPTMRSFVNLPNNNEMQSKIAKSNQPFVKIHVDLNVLRNLTRSASPDENISMKYENIDNNHNNSQKVYELRSLYSSKSINKIDRRNINDKLQDLLNSCKTCTVLLTRCDDKLVTPSAQASRQINSIVLKQRKRYSRRKNVRLSSRRSISRKSTPKSRKSKLEAVKYFNEDLNHSKSLHEHTTSEMSEKKSLEETDTATPEASSFQNEVQKDLVTTESIQLTNELKLKELRVSLIRLPEIKKEVLTPDTAVSNDEVFQCTVCGMFFSTKRIKDRHVRKYHTAFISSICKARFRSKRNMLKHYLREHCIMGSLRCCVCRRFFQTQFLLRRHLILHCIKVVMDKNEECPPRVITKCNFIQTIRKRTTCSLPTLTERREVVNIEKNNLNMNSINNVPNEVAKHEDTNNEIISVADDQVNIKVASDNRSDLLDDSTVIYLCPNNDNENLEQEETPLLDPLYTINGSSSTFNPVKETQIDSTSTPNAANNESVPTLSNIVGTMKTKYPCSICGQQFQKLESLLQHRRTYTQSLQHSCKLCAMYFSSRKILKNHISATHDTCMRNYYTLHCHFCSQGFRTENNLRIHELHYHATMEETVDKQQARKSMRMFSSEDRLKQSICHICQLNFNTHERYQLHFMYYRIDYVFSCNFCDLKFQGLYRLHHHKKLCHYPEDTINSYKYRCSHCYEGFIIESHLRGHMSHVHPDKLASSLNVSTPSIQCDTQNKSYACLKCHLEFPTIVKLMVHVEYYTNDGNYQCSHCTRRCCTLVVLNRHVQLSHSDNVQNGYKCGICEEVLISATSLLCHKKHVHQNFRSLQSSSVSCGTVNTNLHGKELNVTANNQVIPTTTESEKETSLIFVRTSMPAADKSNITCPICNIKFNKEEYLSVHLAEYLNVGDYSCNECQRRFANAQLLRKHVTNHSKKDIPHTKYYCSICNESFQFLIVYESHVAHMHARLFLNNVPSASV